MDFQRAVQCCLWGFPSSALLCEPCGPLSCGPDRTEAVRFTSSIRRLNTSIRSSVKAMSAPSNRPKLLRISEEMRQWSAMLDQELSSWPRVTSRPMFGLIGFYHRGAIFAALPRTRALGTPSSIIFKIDPLSPALSRRARKDPRIGSERRSLDGTWHSFELNTIGDLRDALWWLNRAYQAAT